MRKEFINKMGYGTNLKDAIISKGWSISEAARRSGISANTLRTIIHRDSAVRYDQAILLSNVLGIDINTITDSNPFMSEKVFTEYSLSDTDSSACMLFWSLSVHFLLIFSLLFIIFALFFLPRIFSGFKMESEEL